MGGLRQEILQPTKSTQTQAHLLIGIKQYKMWVVDRLVQRLIHQQHQETKILLIHTTKYL